MSSNNSNHITEELVSQVSDILKLGKIKHYGYDELLIKCPFCRAKAHSLFVNMPTGEYYCSACGMGSNFKDLDIDILGSFTKITNNLSRRIIASDFKGVFLEFHFVNKNLEDILSVARFEPSIISVKRGNDKDFVFRYYFYNLELNTVQYTVIALRLLYDFKELISEQLSHNEIMVHYSGIQVNDLFYKVIDHYSDSQLNSLITLFGNRLNNN